MDSETASEAKVTTARALAETAHDNYDAAEFIAECGDHPEYAGGAVLAWLGY